MAQMAYQTQPGGMHPGMALHGGHPGMTPGQPMTQAQMQQMGHPGASGPGQPHVTQAGVMMGMQPGANGMGMGGQMGGMLGQMGGQSMAGGMQNAQALSQMNPALQQQMMQQQQQQQQMMAQNPQMAMQQQQHMLQRRAMMQQQQAQQQQQQQQQGGMQGMSPQQIQQLQHLQQQQNNQGMSVHAVPLTPNLAAQVQARQQAQAQAQHQAQQQAQSQQMQQHQLAMQHANSQQSNQSGQAGPPNQHPGQQQQAPQMRPQSRMANPNEQNQPQAQHTPQPGGQGQQQQQTPQQNMQQQGQQQMTPQQQQQQMQVMQQRQRLMQQQAQAQAQQGMANQIRIAQAQQTQQNMQGQSILRLVHLCDELSSFTAETGKEVALWQQIIDKHFSPEGRLVHAIDAHDGKTWEVPRPTIARYFQSYFDSGAVSLRIHADHPRENSVQGGRLHVAYSSSTFAVVYPNGARLEMRGSMNFLFSPSMELLECMEIRTTRSDEVISRSKIEELLSTWSPTMDNKSPKLSKKPPTKAQQKAQSALEGLTIDHFPKTPKGPYGTPKRVQQWLELGETMNIMNDLVGFAGDSNLRPSQALDQLVRTYEREQQMAQQQQNQQQQQDAAGNGGGGNPQINLPNGNRTPSMGNMAMPGQPNHFASPAMSNMSGPLMNGSPHIPHIPGLAPGGLNMPNSHTPSPHQSNMAAPPMIPQPSQQGTNSSAASANTSPNVNNKRRRSTVKMEGDDGGGEGGPAPRVKPSPRIGKKEKPGGGG